MKIVIYNYINNLLNLNKNNIKKNQLVKFLNFGILIHINLLIIYIVINN